MTLAPFFALITPVADTGGAPPGVGGSPPSIWPGIPTHPIVLPPLTPGEPPVTIWPGPGPLPGIEHPIVLPPDNPAQPPPSVWPNPPEGIAPTPEHPIFMPDPPPPAGTLITWKVIWSPSYGWVVVGVPNVPHPVPSK